ncbi:hypothetical protein NLJ89_g2825 [Agrocybe chaxingu]|uniref:Uncharacterized protein n=1 Tax=Agrocybe chaxingu TaxID=84603 RepID=A0A9W8K3N2_9AGAR|nr:hypothetical protein NLJ89_g2825 [Agrocybe chaxingu]
MDWKPPFVDAPPPATPLPWLLPAPPQPRVALDQVNLGFIDTNRLLKTYFKFPEDEDEEDSEGDTLLKDQDQDMENELESPPLLSCNPLSPSAVPPSARTIYSVPRRPESEAFPNRSCSPTSSESPSRRTVQRAPSPTLGGSSSSSTDTSVSSDFATILRVYVGSDTDDESDSDESYVEDTRAHAQRVDKGKGRAVEPGSAPGWEANVEAGDFQYLCVGPQEVFGVEENLDREDDHEGHDDEYVENGDESLGEPSSD